MTHYNFRDAVNPRTKRRSRVRQDEREFMAVEAAIRRLHELDPDCWPIDAAMEQRLQDEAARFTARRVRHGRAKHQAE